MRQIMRKILKKMIKKPHLDHTQALLSYVSGSLGTLTKVFLVWVRKYFSNPLIDVTTKRFNKSKSKKKMKRKPHPPRQKNRYVHA
ncbi:hypothetical protein BIZ43_03870 [Helicobacter pylori]|nr:hypothetical protein [Helicobacter pylori]OLR41688.1 hypothetical protein BIZ43_03870 [Helicobacter pylori]